MPACSCPRCRTQIWVKDEQLKIAQGFVVCTQCESLFKAKDNIIDLKGKFQPKVLPTALSDLRLEREGRLTVQAQKQLSRNEIADLLDSFTVSPKPAAAAPLPTVSKSETNWTLAVLVALTVLIIQFFYLVLLL